MRISSTLPPDRRVALYRVIGLYLLFGVLWIVVADHVLAGLVGDLPGYVQWRTLEGWVFIAASTAVLFLLVRRELVGRERAEEKYRGAFEANPDTVALSRLETGEIVEVNEGFEEHFGYTAEEAIGTSALTLALWADPDDRTRYTDRLSREGVVHHLRTRLRGKDGRIRPCLVSGRRLTLNGEEYILSVATDVSEVEFAREALEDQVRRLRGLREIDLAIAGALDLRIVLNVILEQVLEHLPADAADILLAREEGQRLELGQKDGFRSSALDFTDLAVGEGYAGRVARDRETVHVPDVREEPDGFRRSEKFREEGFVTYFGVPLIAKGKVNGVLEVYQRERFDPERAWRDYLDALASQAAIALDNAALLLDLEDTNRELRQAYEETIRGWSRAMDLRDRDTQGHTERVAETVVRFARRLRVPESEIVHVRRGALLHDIGKMGISDAILNKPGPLDDDEWEVMEEHPVLAHRLLAPIGFLKPALDIPYCHHEKWDGSGYPRGLEGEEIPLAARIFAVVDVWDALRSDRPYRDAWPREKILAHLREEAGSHFEPRLVEEFTEMEAEELAEERLEG